jgi:type I restriction enzyme R subunit
MPTPEELARIKIDEKLTACGWIIQNMSGLNRYASLGVAVREFALDTGEADYLLFVDGKAVGVVEAKPEGTTLSGVAEQAGHYVVGLPKNIPHVAVDGIRPDMLPFQYESTGIETLFRDNRDPAPRSRRAFAFHRPETLQEWLTVGTDGIRPDGDEMEEGARRAPRPAPTLRGRLQNLPPLNPGKMWSAQVEAVTCLEASLAQDKPRALIQMATGSGKTFTAINAIYRLIKFGKAKRVLFLVDRANLAKQALKEFQAFETSDDGRKFTELYNVTRLESNAIDPVNKVVITTIQRLYSILSGEVEFDAQNEEGSLFEVGSALDRQPPKEVKYNPRLPIEFFDIIITDECHRSIYNLWRGVLEYFDAHLIGLTATPSKQTLGFFNQNLVMEYSRTRAVADSVNVDGWVYRIRTRIGDSGNIIEAGEWVGKRDKVTRAERMELLDQDFAYNAEQLDRSVVAPNQIRTILQTFKDRLPTDIFPGRSEVPKTLIFAKDDSHAEDIVHIAREVFGKGDEFCKKITYQVQNPEQLISDFRNAYFPRIAVTVDMIATGTDIKPVEILIFMRAVKSRILFEQMLGRGTRVISQTDLRGVNPDPNIQKDHFVIVDAVGILDQAKVETQSLERKKSVSFEKLMGLVAAGAVDEDVVSSLAGRLIRLNKDLSTNEAKEVNSLAGEGGLPSVIKSMIDEIEKDAPDLERAVRPLAANPALRNRLIEIKKSHEQVMDESPDEVTSAGFDSAATERARATVESFRAFIEEYKDEITALQILFSIPRRDARRASDDKAKGRMPSAPTYEQLRELAETLQQPPRTWTTESLWRAYATLERDRVRGVNERRVLADLVSLVRHAVLADEELVPYPERVARRYREWIVTQEAAGRTFTPAQRWWLDSIAAHIGVNLSIAADDLNNNPFFEKGGRVAAVKAFGQDLPALLHELNEALSP